MEFALVQEASQAQSATPCSESVRYRAWSGMSVQICDTIYSPPRPYLRHVAHFNMTQKDRRDVDLTF
jgi:hypothetical protein